MKNLQNLNHDVHLFFVKEIYGNTDTLQVLMYSTYDEPGYISMLCIYILYI